MREKEFFLRPICCVMAKNEDEATDKIYTALFTNAGIEIRGWASE